MDKEIMTDILKSVQGQPSSSGLNPTPPQTPPRNPIVPKKKADEWDETFTRLEQKVDGIIVDQDAAERRLEGGLATQLLMNAQVRSLTRQMLIRDIVIILLLVATLIIVGFNTTQLWHW